MPVEFQDYYQTLGVSRDASQAEIKKAFRNLARKHHPDHAKADGKVAAEDKMKELNEAYEVLRDPDKRAKYDRLGANWRDYERAGAGAAAGAGRGGPGPGGGWRTYHYGGGGPGGAAGEREFHFGGTGFSDFFEQFFGMSGGGGSPYAGDGGFPGSGAGGGGFSARGQDVEAEIMVTLEEVLNGSVRKVSLKTVDPHTGAESVQTYNVRIPPGVREGQRLRLAGRGESGVGQGAAGDLFLKVRRAPHPDLRVQGDTLFYDLEIAPWEAVLGASVTVRVLDDEMRLKIPPGSGNGRQLRLRGKGLPKPDGARGDLHVVLSIEVPSQVDPDEKEAWERLAQSSRFNPREP